jgi:hypothetical protein
MWPEMAEGTREPNALNKYRRPYGFHRQDRTDRAEVSRRQTAVPFFTSWTRWGLSRLVMGMVIGGAAGLWLAMIYTTLYGIGGDNYSGPLSLTSEQEAWVYVAYLGLGGACGGAGLATVSGLMGFVWGIVQAKSPRAVKSCPALPGSLPQGEVRVPDLGR